MEKSLELCKSRSRASTNAKSMRSRLSVDRPQAKQSASLNPEQRISYNNTKYSSYFGLEGGNPQCRNILRKALPITPSSGKR